MNAQAAAIVFAARKCCGKCGRYFDPARMTSKRTPCGGRLYLCPRCTPPARSATVLQLPTPKA